VLVLIQDMPYIINVVEASLCRAESKRVSGAVTISLRCSVVTAANQGSSWGPGPMDLYQPRSPHHQVILMQRCRSANGAAVDS